MSKILKIVFIVVGVAAILVGIGLWLFDLASFKQSDPEMFSQCVSEMDFLKDHENVQFDILNVRESCQKLLEDSVIHEDEIDLATD